MDHQDPDAFITPCAPEPEVVIDLVTIRDEIDLTDDAADLTPGEIKAMRRDVDALKQALDQAQL